MIIIESGAISIGPGIGTGDIPAIPVGVGVNFITENNFTLITEDGNFLIEES